ncbi:MAG: glycerate kinase [Antricoccus sp.]
MNARSPMRVLIAPDSFGETLTATQAAEAIARGWTARRPDDEPIVRPMSDGGPGFVQVMSVSLSGRLIDVATTDPLGRPVPGQIFLADDGVAYVESAQACGLHLLSETERDPRITSTYGVGTLMLAASEAGAGAIVVGLGGSATNDGGVGMLSAIGIGAFDEAGEPLPPGGAALVRLDHFTGFPMLRQSRIVAATDVNNPLLGLRGASNVFGPQKGADLAMVQQLDIALERFAEIAVRDIPPTPEGLAQLPGAGAAGGMGAALYCLNGVRQSGIGLVMTATGFSDDVQRADLVVTGEGKFDQQSLSGKVLTGVAEAAQQEAVPCVAIAGQVDMGRRQAAAFGFDAEYSMADHAGSIEESIRTAVQTLESLAGVVAGDWSR